ncbi:diaminopimelate decarboxylase [Candidatus Marinamargulisbacteria bacterium SCGC AG-333-B06]|nr:diaminopimelate decarboxylase [Candidatus Marinamargulisbacteria bacterium SCGC AG-333-B06]
MSNYFPLSFSYKDGVAFLGDVSLQDVVQDYGSPLYVLDSQTIVNNCQKFLTPLATSYPNSQVLYACKANLTVGLAQFLHRLGMFFDVSSGGELFTLIQAGIPHDSIYFHGNNKTRSELQLALDYNVTIIIDNLQELTNIIELNSNKESVRIMVRIKPEIDAHTHDYIKTGNLDSKFGIEKQDFEHFFSLIMSHSWIQFIGIHSHIGSQIFDTKPYYELVDTMMPFLKQLVLDFKLEIAEFNCGGGMGIFYSEGDSPFDIADFMVDFTGYIAKQFDLFSISRPKLLFEPGRSIIGSAGITLYEVGVVKDIPNVKSYLFIDGGMADNIRPLLYNSLYMMDKIQKSNNSLKTYSIAGKYCESGDVLADNVLIEEVAVGDHLIVFSTGAYNYSMASNYNRNCRPAMIMIEGNAVIPLLERETYDDLIRFDCRLNG